MRPTARTTQALARTFNSPRVAWGENTVSASGGQGLYDFDFRKYSPAQGRWISPDPAGLAAVNPADPQAWNRYAYVENTPTGAVDPLGLWGSDVFGSSLRGGYGYSGLSLLSIVEESMRNLENPNNWKPEVSGSYTVGNPADLSLALRYIYTGPPIVTVSMSMVDTQITGGGGTEPATNCAPGTKGCFNVPAQQPDWFRNQNCQSDYLNSQYGPGTKSFVSRFSVLSFMPGKFGGNPSDAILPAILTEGAKIGTAALFKAAGSTGGVTATSMASLIPTLYGTSLDAEAKFKCRNVTALSGD